MRRRRRWRRQRQQRQQQRPIQCACASCCFVFALHSFNSYFCWNAEEWQTYAHHAPFEYARIVSSPIGISSVYWKAIILGFDKSANADWILQVSLFFVCFVHSYTQHSTHNVSVCFSCATFAMRTFQAPTTTSTLMCVRKQAYDYVVPMSTCIEHNASNRNEYQFFPFVFEFSRRVFWFGCERRVPDAALNENIDVCIFSCMGNGNR